MRVDQRLSHRFRSQTNIDFNNAERCVYPAVLKHILFILKTSRHTLPMEFELAFSEWEAGTLTRMLDYSPYLLRPGEWGFTRTAGLRYINNKCLQRLLITKFGYVNVILKKKNSSLILVQTKTQTGLSMRQETDQKKVKSDSKLRPKVGWVWVNTETRKWSSLVLSTTTLLKQSSPVQPASWFIEKYQINYI